MDFRAHATASLWENFPFIHPWQNIPLVHAALLGKSASSNAAAMHISSVMFSPSRKTPRKMPGNPRLLFTWFGKSLRPVATILAPASSASQGQISGMGLAHANIMASCSHCFDPFFLYGARTLFDAATTASTPLKASSTPPVLPSPLVFCVTSYFQGSSSWVMSFCPCARRLCCRRDDVARLDAPLHKHVGGADVGGA